MPSANDFAAAALRLLNVIQPGEDPSSEDGETAFDVLNRWIDSLGTKRQSMYFLTRTTQTLSSGTASYSIGSGGTINIVRPLWIEAAGLILDTSATYPDEKPIRVLTDDEYAAWTQKTFQSTYALGIWYDHNWSSGLGLIRPLPIPNVSTTQLVLYTPTAVTQFTDQSTNYTFPPGYQRAIVNNLAQELTAYYPSAKPPPMLGKMAADSLMDILKGNLRLEHVVIDALPGRTRTGMTASRFAGGLF